MQHSSFIEMRSAVISEIAQLAREKYVFPEIGDTIASQIQQKLETGVYDDIPDEWALAIQLTQDLRQLSNDHHWNVAYDPRGAPEQVDPENEADQEGRHRCGAPYPGSSQRSP